MHDNDEPRLEDVLVDPIVHAVMRRDAVSPVALNRLIAEARDRLMSPHSPDGRGN